MGGEAEVTGAERGERGIILCLEIYFRDYGAFDFAGEEDRTAGGSQMRLRQPFTLHFGGKKREEIPCWGGDSWSIIYKIKKKGVFKRTLHFPLPVTKLPYS